MRLRCEVEECEEGGGVELGAGVRFWFFPSGTFVFLRFMSFVPFSFYVLRPVIIFLFIYSRGDFGFVRLWLWFLRIQLT